MPQQVLNGVVVSVGVLRLRDTVLEAAVVLLLVIQVSDFSRVVVGVGRCRASVEATRRQLVDIEAAAVASGSVLSISAAHALRAQICQRPRLVRGRVLVVQLVLQDAHARVRIGLCQLHVCGRELSGKAAGVQSALKLVVCVFLCHILLLSHSSLPM